MRMDERDLHFLSVAAGRYYVDTRERSIATGRVFFLLLLSFFLFIQLHTNSTRPSTVNAVKKKERGEIAINKEIDDGENWVVQEYEAVLFFPIFLS